MKMCLQARTILLNPLYRILYNLFCELEYLDYPVDPILRSRDSSLLLPLYAMPSLAHFAQTARASPIFVPAARLTGVQLALALVKAFAPLSPRERAPGLPYPPPGLRIAERRRSAVRGGR